MNVWHKIKRPPWRTVTFGFGFLFFIAFAYLLWTPGLDIRDGRHDLGRNGIWLGHGWLGADEWFIRNKKTNDFERFRNTARIRDLEDRLRRHHITDVFPHLCPADPDGSLPGVDAG